MSFAVRTQGLCKAWGSFRANSDIDLSVRRGARHALIGPNGAGKTTLVNLLTGVYRPDAGEIFIDDERVSALSQHDRVRRGLSRTFQINTLFSGLTVLESVVLAIVERDGRGLAWWRPWRGLVSTIAEASELLRRLGLAADGDTLTGSLPYGKQRLVEIALALAAKPRVLVLDEPAAGIPAAESGQLFSIIAGLPDDVTVLFIEHDMDLVFRFADRITVLAGGRILADGTPDDIAADPRVRETYLGEMGNE